MRWSDISPDGVWTISTEKREKGNAGALKLPKLALGIIAAQPRLAGNPHVFAGNGGDARAVEQRHKVALDKASGVTDWRLHDLRRTARSLMSRAGVLNDHAELVLGHALPGVEGVYDLHRYDQEKAEALRRLAALIERIVHGRRQRRAAARGGGVTMSGDDRERDWADSLFVAERLFALDEATKRDAKATEDAFHRIILDLLRSRTPSRLDP